jgi:hypothetical protein
MASFDPISEDFLGNPLEFENGDGQGFDDFTLELAAVSGAVSVPFIASVTAVYAVQLPEIDPPFIGSVTVVYTPTVAVVTRARLSQQTVEVVRSGSANVRVSQQTLEVLRQTPTSTNAGVSQVVVEVLYRSLSNVDVPFIPSRTRVYGVFSLFGDATGSGPGNGGESFAVRLAPNGTSVTATLAAAISDTGTLLELTGDSGLPAAEPFVLTVDAEVLYVARIAAGVYRVRGRGMSNTTPAAHLSGASATWTDSYDQAIEASANIDASFTADIASTGLTTYAGWLICFDSSQAYLAGARYLTHVSSVLGVFTAGAGSTGASKCDAAQPNAIATSAGVSDDCPAALSNPARISSDIVAGDVAVVRYTNPEAAALDLGPRSCALQ